MGIIDKIKSTPKIKSFVLWLITSKQNPKPRLWVKLLINPIKHKKGKKSLIRRRTRMDVFPWNMFRLGNCSTIEDFSTINNGVGDVTIGDNVRIGLGNTIIGPVQIGNNIRFAQNIVVSGLNHNYADPDLPICDQGVSTAPIIIHDDSWIGSNCTIVSGVTIGKHCVIAAGSVVTKDIPPYSLVVGNPARVIKQYDRNENKWQKINL